MVLFGKEIKLDANMSPKEAKLLLVFISVLVVGLLGYFQMVVPVLEIKKVNNEIEMKKSEKLGEEAKLKAAQREYESRLQMYNEQNENYLMSKSKFDQASLVNDTSLKDMIAEMAEEVGVKIVEVGAVEVIEENEQFTKKYFPYTVQSDVNRLGRLFYWLENSNQLVTFKGSPLEIQLTESAGIAGIVTVKMKVGAYFNEVNLKEEKGIEESKGEANE